MTFSSKMTRCPIPHNAELAQDTVAHFGDLTAPLRDLIAGTAGCSPYLAALLARERDWISQLEDSGAQALRDSVVSAPLEGSEIGAQMRQAKRRIALLTALADLGGVWPLEKVTQALTDLADRALQAALSQLVAAEIRRGKLPGLGEDDIATSGGMCLLAMGKMGAGELNYSSDIDLICLFDETRFEPGDYMEARAAFVRITRRLMALISENTAEGYVFRTDLRLRPDASVTPVCIAMEAAERYYESVGRSWERAAFIKARPCAGDTRAGAAFLDRLSPFVWRKHLDFAAIQDAHDMRLRIRDHKGLHGVALEGQNVKLGPGGIREIEFFTQTRQLIAGGRDASLRVRGTCEGLDRLAASGWIGTDVADRLSRHYRDWREVEHRLQMIGDAQTHVLPNSDEGFDRLARFMGEGNTKAFKDRLGARMREVSGLCEEFFAPTPTAEPGAEGADLTAYLDRWRSFPALRSERSVGIFKRLFPGILKRLNAAAQPEEALDAFERFLRGLPAGVQVFSLFEANPDLTDLFVEICTASPDLAAYLARNAQVLDAVIGGDFFAPWPGAEALARELEGVLGRASDYEDKLDAARRWQKEWHFRISVHYLRALITPEEAGAEYADLAQAVLDAVFPVVCAQLALKHGPAPGRGAMLLGMGSLGAARLTTRSDLDLIVIYDAAGIEASDGPRPLSIRAYYARLTQALVTALSAPTAAGKLYEVDMRLRPSGQAGPVATSIASFRAYQMEEAWAWEHMALTRARPITGNADLVGDVAQVRQQVLEMPREPAKVISETRDMRARLADARPESSVWAVKDGPGGQQDIELLAQCFAILTGCLARDVPGQLAASVAQGYLDRTSADVLEQAYTLFWRVQQTGRLLTDKPLDPTALGQDGQRVLLRECGAADLESLDKNISTCRKQALEVIETALAAGD
ncbi:MAG: glutamine-synthetase adenylyltransferase [Paracoccaceae bacterium]